MAIIVASCRVADWPRLIPFLRQFVAGVASRIKRGPERLNPENVRRFFERHRNTNPDPLVFDGATSGYYEQLFPLLANDSSIMYLDLGCGVGNLRNFLIENKFSFARYVGVDFAGSSTKFESGSTVIDADIRSQALASYVTDRTHVICVNSLCYQDNLSAITVLRHAATYPDNRLLVVEPYPGIYWDESFYGVRPCYRTPEQLGRDLLPIGWSIEATYIYHLLRFGAKYIWPLSYVAAYRPVMSDHVNLLGSA